MSDRRSTAGNRRDWLAEAFERERVHLRGVAYRMLGSVSEAEDAVQEAWVRLDRRDPGGIDNLRGWLTVVVGRICLDTLRSRRTRREDYAGSWLPEPIVTGLPEASPEDDAVLADSVGLALLVVLETLTPAERLAFVLHDVFAVPFDEIAEVVGRTPAATRQLASRGRRRVRESAPSPEADLAVQRRVVDAFLAAARGGDFDALVRVLDPDVVLRTDGGGSGPLARPPIVGAVSVARELVSRGTPFAPLAEPAIVNGGAGAIVRAGGRPRYVIGFSVVDGRITTIDIVGDPAKVGRRPHTKETE
jgi:RNA polymerase sigma factor (sigma-70 family)